PVPALVSLIGAGPGDPGLITVRGRDALERAACVLHDHLANPALLKLAPQAEHIYVGKKRAEHAATQTEITDLLILKSRAGLRTVRLKGGDPYLFGRGGEEAEALALAGVPFEVIPGVTASLGIGAYSGVPLTHRDHNSAVTFVTGHDPSSINWTAIAASETLVVYMGLSTIGEIAERLIAAGRSPDTPAIAVRWGTRPEQSSLRATLSSLAAGIETEHLRPPATIIIGDVVSLSDRLNWYERLPLFGRRIVLTRAEEQAAETAEIFQALGAGVVELPTIAIRPPLSWAALDTAIERLSTYDWIIFTSVNGVRFFLERLDASSHDLRSLRARIAVIGEKTRDAVQALHLNVDLLPHEFVAESLLKAFAAHELAGQRILIPRAEVARELLPHTLRKRGATVDVVPAYRNAIPEDAPARAAEIFANTLQHPPPHWITFTAASTVKNLLTLVPREALANIRIASIGPVTTEVLLKHGLTIDAEASPYTMAGLIAAILRAEQ
ncbi:MAG: uroporphyrinogen-III C-methyltransferase, partial [Acidobacteriota bacterium]